MLLYPYMRYPVHELEKNMVKRWATPQYRHRRETLLTLAIVCAVFCLLVLFSLAIDGQVTPHWDGVRYTCPAGLYPYGDEHEARAGKPFVHCVEAIGEAVQP